MASMYTRRLEAGLVTSIMMEVPLIETYIKIVGTSFGVSEDAQAHATPHKAKIAQQAENKPFLNILCIFLYWLTTFCGYRSLLVKSVGVS